MFDLSPESMKKQAANNLRASLAMQKKVIDWQMDQARLMEKQVHTALATQRAMVEDTVGAMTSAQTAMVDAMFPPVAESKV
jgi:hypothetical protein